MERKHGTKTENATVSELSRN